VLNKKSNELNYKLTPIEEILILKGTFIYCFYLLLVGPSFMSWAWASTFACKISDWC